MGTLFEQSPRNYRHVEYGQLSEELSIVKGLAEEHEVSVQDVIRLKHTLELERRNNLMVDDRDRHDEQMAGIGELLREVKEALVNIGFSFGPASELDLGQSRVSEALTTMSEEIHYLARVVNRLDDAD